MALNIPEETIAVHLIFEFTGQPSAQGLLSFYWDGVRIESIDQRFTDTGPNTILVPIPPNSPAGTYPFGFRLDVFSPEPSSVIVNHIRTVKIVPVYPCHADITDNGSVNVDDLLAIINSWGPCPSPCPADISQVGPGNGVVNVDDLLAVINGWGPCP